MPIDTASIPFSLATPALVGFIVCLLLLPFYIKWLKQKQVGQFIRQEGPTSHSAKAKTPTMGGVCFIVATLISALGLMLVLKYFDWPVMLVLLTATACGIIGLVDDLAKFRRQANAGISARLRLLLELGLGLTLAACLLYLGSSGQILWPGAWIDSAGLVVGPALTLPVPAFLLFSAFIVAAGSNALNLHDGMDGLSAGTSMQVLATMSLILAGTGQWLMAGLAAATAGSAAAFLIFNRYPAKIFMGDTGSLFLGGMMAALAIAGKVEIWFIALTSIYILETLSVMAQVVYFKLTKSYEPETPISPLSVLWVKLTRRLPGEGKRLFRMAPLHHHFEAVAADYGWSEWQVVAGFWLVQLLICTMVLIAFKLSL